MNLKVVETGPSYYEKRIYRAADSQRLRKTAFDRTATGIGTALDLGVIDS